MNQNKFTFESEDLVVDWISFNLQGSVICAHDFSPLINAKSVNKILRTENLPD
jgi:hypothetical protein